MRLLKIGLENSYTNFYLFSVSIVTDITKLDASHAEMIRNIIVDFPENHNWIGPYDSVVKVEAEKLKVTLPRNTFIMHSNSNYTYIILYRRMFEISAKIGMKI